MTAVFMAGSIKIKMLDRQFVERIKKVVSDGFHILVGDANGADASIQAELLSCHAENVTVYCSGSTARNNIGNWNLKCVSSDAPAGTRKFFTAKDLAMAKDAEYGLFIWDSVSTGTLGNVIELHRSGNKSVVFVKKIGRFLNIKSADDLIDLVSMMSDKAKDQADRKIGLRAKLSDVASSQLGLQL